MQVMVFSWSGCPFCKNAKALLSDLGAQYTALELDSLGQEGKAIRAELAEVPAAKYNCCPTHSSNVLVADASISTWAGNTVALGCTRLSFGTAAAAVHTTALTQKPGAVVDVHPPAKKTD